MILYMLETTVKLLDRINNILLDPINKLSKVIRYKVNQKSCVLLYTCNEQSKHKIKKNILFTIAWEKIPRNKFYERNTKVLH